VLVQADVGDLGIGVGTPRQDQRTSLRPAEQKCVLNDYSGMGVGKVRELVARLSWYVAAWDFVGPGQTRLLLDTGRAWDAEENCQPRPGRAGRWFSGRTGT
jgi:hypothetical protein